MTSLNSTTHEIIMVKLMTSFQYKPQSKEEAKDLIDTYFKSFSKMGITDEILKNVAQRLILSWRPSYGVKFPFVKDFIDLAGVSASSIAERAFKGIRSRISETGNYKPLTLGEKPEAEHKRSVAFAVINHMGGWSSIGKSGIKVWDKREKEFLDLYEGFYYKEVPKIDYLLGNSNLNNQEFLEKYNTNQIENTRKE